MNFKDKLEDDIVKILVIGDATVGKTSFIQKYVADSFTGDYKCTIGVDFTTKILERHGELPSRIKLQFWDIAGQERYTLLTRAYYKYARGCIIMFDLTNKASFDNVMKWKKAVDSQMNEDCNNNIPCILVANKTDLPGREITYEQIENKCHEGSFIEWTEISVRDGTMVDESVTYLLDVIFERSPSVYIPSDYVLVDKVNLVKNEELNKKKKKSCCR